MAFGALGMRVSPAFGASGRSGVRLREPRFFREGFKLGRVGCRVCRRPGGASCVCST